MLTTKQKLRNLNNRMLVGAFICLVGSLVMCALSYDGMAFILMNLGLIAYIVSKGAKLYEVVFCMAEHGAVSRVCLFVINLFFMFLALYVLGNVLLRA